jgi:hypothetical protein
MGSSEVLKTYKTKVVESPVGPLLVIDASFGLETLACL